MAEKDARAERFAALLEHIDAHLHEPLGLARLSAIAGCSVFHFQRRFKAVFGLSPSRYIQRRRLRRASYQLAFRGGATVLDIALANGYAGPEAFARAFVRIVGQSPSRFRRRPDWPRWHAAFPSADPIGSPAMHQPFPDESVRLVLTEDIRVAVLAHHGDPRRLGDTLRRFIDWRRRHRLPPGSSATYNLLYGDPERVPPEAFRLDLCVAVRRPLGADGEGLADGLIPGGRCAVLRHVGDERGLAEAIRGLCEVWLPRSGEHRRDFPVYLQRLSFYPEVPEREAATDIFLPLHPLPSASA